MYPFGSAGVTELVGSSTKGDHCGLSTSRPRQPLISRRGAQVDGMPALFLLIAAATFPLLTWFSLGVVFPLVMVAEFKLLVGLDFGGPYPTK
jgi:hypothetical protein